MRRSYLCIEIVDEEPEVMSARTVRLEELRVQSDPAHRTEQLDLHVSAAREPDLDRAGGAAAAEVVLDISRRQRHELAASEGRTH